MSGCIHRLSNLHSPVFLLNSCLDLFSAPRLLEDPLFRRYGVNLPSSLTMIHPSALVYSTRPRVSVYSTGTNPLKFSRFSREHGYQHYRIVPKNAPYYRVSARKVYLTAFLITYALQPSIPSDGGCVTSPSLHHADW